MCFVESSSPFLSPIMYVNCGGRKGSMLDTAIGPSCPLADVVCSIGAIAFLVLFLLRVRALWRCPAIGCYGSVIINSIFC